MAHRKVEISCMSGICYAYIKLTLGGAFYLIYSHKNKEKIYNKKIYEKLLLVMLGIYLLEVVLRFIMKFMYLFQLFGLDMIPILLFFCLFIRSTPETFN